MARVEFDNSIISKLKEQYEKIYHGNSLTICYKADDGSIYTFNGNLATKKTNDKYFVTDRYTNGYRETEENIKIYNKKDAIVDVMGSNIDVRNSKSTIEGVPQAVKLKNSTSNITLHNDPDYKPLFNLLPTSIIAQGKSHADVTSKETNNGPIKLSSSKGATINARDYEIGKESKTYKTDFVANADSGSNLNISAKDKNTTVKIESYYGAKGYAEGDNLDGFVKGNNAKLTMVSLNEKANNIGKAEENGTFVYFGNKNKFAGKVGNATMKVINPGEKNNDVTFTGNSNVMVNEKQLAEKKNDFLFSIFNFLNLIQFSS